MTTMITTIGGDVGTVRRLLLRLWLVLVVLLLLCETTTTAEVTTNNNKFYLYVTTANTTSSPPAHHVHEYTRPPRTTNEAATADLLTPNFLTSDYPHGRIVNFYAQYVYIGDLESSTILSYTLLYYTILGVGPCLWLLPGVVCLIAVFRGG